MGIRSSLIAGGRRPGRGGETEEGKWGVDLAEAGRRAPLPAGGISRGCGRRSATLTTARRRSTTAADPCPLWRLQTSHRGPGQVGDARPQRPPRTRARPSARSGVLEPGSSGQCSSPAQAPSTTTSSQSRGQEWRGEAADQHGPDAWSSSARELAWCSRRGAAAGAFGWATQSGTPCSSPRARWLLGVRDAFAGANQVERPERMTAAVRGCRGSTSPESSQVTVMSARVRWGDVEAGGLGPRRAHWSASTGPDGPPLRAERPAHRPTDDFSRRLG